MISKNLLVTAILGLSALPLVAQKPPSRVEVRMLAFDRSMAMGDIYAQDPAAPPAAASTKTPVRNALNHEFTTLQLTGSKIVFTKKADRESMTREGELVAEVSLPEGVKSAILLLLPASKDSKALSRIMPINDSKRVFPAGSYYATNLSPLKVRMVLEEKNFDFSPAQTLLIANPPMREDYQIGMRTYAFKDNEWLQMASSIWSAPGKRRSVLILYPDAATGYVQLRAFDDVMPRAETDEAAPVR